MIFPRYFLRGAAKASSQAGDADVRGYFHWTLLGNFEWPEGYRQRYGLFHLGYPSGRRPPKHSFPRHQCLIATNSGSLES